jgi:hypothetical protein
MCTLLFLGGCSSISEKKQALSDSDYLVILTKDQNNEVELCIQHGDKSRKIDEIDPSNINVIEEAQILIYSSPENDVYAYDYSSFDNEVDLIGNNLILDSLIVIPNTKTLLYQDKNQSLYIQNLGEIRKKIASDVNDFKVGQAKKIIYYTSMDNNLYQYIGGENLKIASNVNWFTTDTIGESLIYRDTDNDVYVKWKNQDNIEYLVSGGKLCAVL